MYQLDRLTSGVYRVTTDAGEWGCFDISTNVTVMTGVGVENVDFVLARKAPTIDACMDSNNSLRFSWEAGRYIAYQVEYTTNLFSPWVKAPSGITENEKNLRSVTSQSTLEYELPESTNSTVFFRLKLIE